VFTGCTTALVTPFRRDRLDLTGFRRNVRYQLRSGVAALLVGGSTGETPTLTEEEWTAIVAAAVEEAAGRVPVMAGAGTNSTAKSVKQVRLAKNLGADAVLVVAPYYNKPTQEGLYRHFRAVADSTGLPVVVYNIPPRSVVNILPATIERLARDCRNVIAVKEASGGLDQATEVRQRCGDRVEVLSGDDSLTLPILAVGGTGVVSVVSNIVPSDVVQLISLFAAGRAKDATTLHLRLFPLIRALFVETNPAPVKAAMNLLGMAAGEPRLPLVRPSDASLTIIRKALLDYGLTAN
jgi:4-hydroxy-tetrahydrodipicolinate synthase